MVLGAPEAGLDTLPRCYVLDEALEVLFALAPTAGLPAGACLEASTPLPRLPKCVERTVRELLVGWTPAETGTWRSATHSGIQVRILPLAGIWGCHTNVVVERVAT
ncbi:MAG: hypothetical protein ACYDA5_06870 [Vulcanimicrobiaceae bacterium]